jgi:hypothetical protein
VSYLEKNPLCVDCLARGRYSQATEIHHIQKLRDAPERKYDRDNLKALCELCHKKETSLEKMRASSPVTLVCGSPGAGKSTYVEQHRRRGDLVWDLDDILRTVAGIDPHDNTEQRDAALDVVLAMRDAFYSRARSYKGRVWVIESCPTRARREWFERELGAHVVFIEATKEQCLARVAHRGPSASAPVERWWSEHDRSVDMG